MIISSISGLFLFGPYYISAFVCLSTFKKVFFAQTKTVHLKFLLFCKSQAFVIFLKSTADFSYTTLPKICLRSSTAINNGHDPLCFRQSAMLPKSLLDLKMTSLLMFNTLSKTIIVFDIELYAPQLRTKPTLTTLTATTITTSGAIHASTSSQAFDAIGYSLSRCTNMDLVLYSILVSLVQGKLPAVNIQLEYLNAVANILTLLLIMLISRPSACPFFL